MAETMTPQERDEEARRLAGSRRPGSDPPASSEGAKSEPDAPQHISALMDRAADAARRAREREKALSPEERKAQAEEREAEETRRRAVQERSRARAIQAVAAEVIPIMFRAARPTGQIEVWVNRLKRHDLEKANLLLAGPTASGKTHNAYAALVGAIHAGVSDIEAVSVPLLLQELRPGGSGKFSVGRLAEAALVMLDDLGAHKGTEWAEEQLFAILDARYAWKRPTVLTTNLKPERERLGERLGDRIARRLWETATIVTLGEPFTRSLPYADN